MAVGITFAGTKVSISAGVPATYNQAGFAALTYTEIGEITSVPGSGGRTYEDVNYNVVSRRATEHRKGTYDEAEQTMEVVVVRDDAGQVLAEQALDSDNEYAFKVEYSDGEISYYQALVTAFEGAGGDANTMRMATVTFRRSSQGTIVIPGSGLNSFTLTYTAGANGSLIGASPQTVARLGSGSPVAAVPNATYEFVEWSDGSTENPRVDVYVQGNVTVTATFALI
jgi:hypothetical protein